MHEDHWKDLLRRAAVELAIYAGLLVIYFLLVLRLLEKPLTRMFHERPWLYAFAGLGLIIVQGVVSEKITSFLVEQMRLERLE